MIEDDQIYVVVDIETDGPVAGLYSMLSLGAVATTKEEEVSSFYRKTLPLEGAAQEPSTMEWWKTQPEAWREVTTDAQPAVVVMNEFCEWVEGLGKKPVFVAHPVAFDYAVVSWYLWKFVNKDPFTNEKGASRTLDITSFIAGKYNRNLENSKRTRLPESLTKGMPEHSHNALDDARGFAVVLRNVLNET
jgi:DNA polymerase III alpha subunit (gram-positive type)